MFILSLRSRRASCSVFALAALLLLPSALSAQPAATEKPRQWVSVTIDYVEVPLVKLVEASQWIASGPQHDAQLLAALVKSGAADTKGLPVFCTDGGTMERGGPISPSRGTIRRMPFQYLDSQYLESRTKAGSHFNADGTVTVALAASVASPFPGESPLFSAEASSTFRDGQTLEVSRTLASSADQRLAYLVFARMAVGSGPVPPLPGPFTVPRVLSLDPPSIDPGMVNASPFDGDPGMVGGRDIDPHRIERMNAYSRLVPVTPNPTALSAPKRK